MPEFPIKLSTLPVLLVLELVAIWFVTRRTAKAGHIGSGGAALINALLLVLLIWAGASAYLATSGFYQGDWFRSSWPAFWVTCISVTIVMTPLILSRGARDTVRNIIDATPLSWLVGFQALRVLAIGGVLKAANGEFSRYFGFYIGIPDLLFGLSALVMTWLVARGSISNTAVAIWNLIGALIILPTGIILLQMGLPGALQYFDETPGIATIFEFPMALAPTVVVPIFVMMNLFIAVRLIERSLAGDTVAA